MKHLILHMLGMISAMFFAVEAIAEEYTLSVGDTLNLSFLGRPEFSGNVTIREDGTIPIHVLGPIEVAGLSLPKAEEAIRSKAGQMFNGNISFVLSIQEYSPFYIFGVVEEPGSYPYRPGLTVIKAIALAGGYERVSADETDTRLIVEAQLRAVQARTRLDFVEREQAALTAQLQILDNESVELEGLPVDDAELVAMEDLRHTKVIEGLTLRQKLAEAEAQIYSERKQVVQRQLDTTEEQLASAKQLTERGLQRRDRMLDIENDVDSVRSSLLEIEAFKARAIQTSADAESLIAETNARYRENLLEDKFDNERQAQLLRSELDAAFSYLQKAAPSLVKEIDRELEIQVSIYREGRSSDPEIADLGSLIYPNDVVYIEFDLESTQLGN